MDKRIAIIGLSNTGKSTLASKVSAKLNLEHVDMDQVYWLPGWIRPEESNFLEKTEKILSKNEWVADGNYPSIHSILKSRATIICYMDIPLSFIIINFFKRNFAELVRRKNSAHMSLYVINKFSRIFFHKLTHLGWIIVSYHKRRRLFREFLESLPKHIDVFVIRKQSDKEKFLEYISNV